MDIWKFSSKMARRVQFKRILFNIDVLVFQMRVITNHWHMNDFHFPKFKALLMHFMYCVCMITAPSEPQSDSLSRLRWLGQSGWCCFLFSPLCVLLSPPRGCCSLLQRWISTGSLFEGVFFNNSRWSICLSDRSLRKSSSYTLSCTNVRRPDRTSKKNMNRQNTS